MRQRLTQRIVGGAKPASKPFEIRDADIGGLLLRVQPSGLRTFYVELSRGVRFRLGRFPVMTVEAARTQAKEKLGIFASTGERPTRSPRVASFRDFLRDRYGPWAKAGMKTGARTVATLEAQFERFLDKPLADVTAWSVEKWKATRLKAGINPATVNRDLVRIKAALAKAVEWNILPDNPLRSVKRARGEDSGRVRYLSAAEEKALRTALAARDDAHRARRESGSAWRTSRGIEPLEAINGYSDHLTPMVILALNTGLRRGELTSIRWDDINLPGRLLTVRAGYAKSGKARHVPLNKEAVGVLEALWIARSDEGRLFPLLDPKKAWAAVLASAKIKAFRFHDLRHTFASNLVMAGVDINTVREFLGHADLTMTLRYAHLAPSHKAAAIEKLTR